MKANVDSDVTAEGLRDRAMKSFPTHPIRECRQFYLKTCERSRAMNGIADLAVARYSKIKHYSGLPRHGAFKHGADFCSALRCSHGALSVCFNNSS
jgi:hypothetical protein